MYGTVLSVLLMGMVPVMDMPAEATGVGHLAVASPSPLASEQLARADIGRSLSASGVVVLDLESGQELYARNPSLRRPMGSLTKLMTALLIVENHSLQELVTVPRSAVAMPGTKAGLSAGTAYTVGDLLSALLIVSGNDAAKALAEFHSGSEAVFVQLMNDRAKALGLRNTSFANASGLDSSSQWSSPRDLAWLALYVMRQPAIRDRMSVEETTIKGAGAAADSRGISLSHTHVLLHEDNAVIAGKTGTTIAAKQCLLSIVREGDREFVVVLLGSRERYADMRDMLRIFRAFFA